MGCLNGLARANPRPPRKHRHSDQNNLTVTWRSNTFNQPNGSNNINIMRQLNTKNNLSLLTWQTSDTSTALFDCRKWKHDYIFFYQSAAGLQHVQSPRSLAVSLPPTWKQHITDAPKITVAGFINNSWMWQWQRVGTEITSAEHNRAHCSNWKGEKKWLKTLDCTFPHSTITR